jgi:hypothetical protein
MVDVVLALNGAQIQGTVLSSPSQPYSTQAIPVPDSTQVVLVPDQRDRYDLYKAARTTTTSRFIFKGVTPGKYKVFAWDDIEPNAWFDPSVLRRYEQFGTPANAMESGNLTLGVKVISRSGEMVPSGK